MAGYNYLRDKVWTPSGAVILPPLIKKALKDKLDGSVKTIQTFLSRDCSSGKTLYVKDKIAYDNSSSFSVSCIGVSSNNTVLKMQPVGAETAILLQDAISGPMVAQTPVLINQTIPSAIMPGGCSIFIDSLMAVNPTEFDIVLKVTNTRDKVNGNFGNISFNDNDAAVIQEALNQIPNATAVLKGYTNATDTVILELGLYSVEGEVLVPEWDLVLPTADELKASVQSTQYVITIDSSGLTQAIDVR